MLGGAVVWRTLLRTASPPAPRGMLSCKASPAAGSHEQIPRPGDDAGGTHRVLESAALGKAWGVRVSSRGSTPLKSLTMR